MAMTTETARRVAAERSIPEPNTGCWLWLGAASRNKAGDEYAAVWDGKRSVRLARALLGLTDPRIKACHTCDTPLCVNEEHLFRGSQRDNVLDMLSKGRYVSGQSGKTHCRRGHEYTPENTRLYTWPRTGASGRLCRACDRERKDAAYRASLS